MTLCLLVYGRLVDSYDYLVSLGMMFTTPAWALYNLLFLVFIIAITVASISIYHFVVFFCCFFPLLLQMAR